MSFNAIAAAGAGQSELLQFFEHGAPVAGRTMLHARNGTDPTINLFIDAVSPKMQYAASIVEVCVERTVYAIHCTSGPVGSATCGPNAQILTLTEGGSMYAFSSATSTRSGGYDIQATVQETCRLDGTTAAVCSATIAGTVDKTSTTASTVSTAAGTDYYRFDVAITGGAEKTANPTACATKSGAAGLSTKAVAVWSLLGAIGVAGLLGC